MNNPIVNAELGTFSEIFMLLAGITYTVAFIFFAWEMVSGGESLKTVSASGTKEERRAKKLAMASAGGAGSAGVKNDGGYSPQVPDLDNSRVASSKGGMKLDSLEYTSKPRPSARVAVALTILGLVIHAIGVVTRAIAANRVPWGNMYEFCTTGALVVVAVFLIVLIKRDLRFIGTFVLGLVVIMMTAAVVVFPTPVAPTSPPLQSPWLVIHVSVAVMASGLFTIAFALSVLQLIQTRVEGKAKAAKSAITGFFANVPSALTLETLAYRLTALGFVLWTFTLMAGALWAEKAWGRYWGWDTKEVWTFIIWVVYAGYLHARATRGWTGVRASWLNMVGYLCVVFNFSIVNIYFSGLHSYSGVNPT